VVLFHHIEVSFWVTEVPVMLDESHLVQLTTVLCSNISENTLYMITEVSASWGASIDSYRGTVL